jgi:large subunit ribosomal protein L31
MKKDIHPDYKTATVTCACGNTFEIGSTQDSISVEVCSVCHPFWTGQQKFVDIEGRVDKFKKKQNIADEARAKKIKSIKKKLQNEKERSEGPKTLKDMLKGLQ